MSGVSLHKFTSSAGAIARDFSEDYILTEGVKDLPLIIPERVELQKRINILKTNVLIDDSTVEKIISAVTQGKHLLFYGPPGTGKTTTAKKIAELFDCSSDMVTATADWSTYDTVGGLKIKYQNNQEQLEPNNGCLIGAALKCCEAISENYYTSYPNQAHWLIIDELNRANMDSAFGQVFTALESSHPEVHLDFHNNINKKMISIPKRFRIIGTMNTYDKNFLFRVSYGLMRRFAYIPILPPSVNDVNANEREKELVWSEAYKTLIRNAPNYTNIKTVEELKLKYKGSMELLYKIIFLVRGGGNKGHLDRGVGTAQIIDCMKHSILSHEMNISGVSSILDSLDSALHTHIVPQLEGVRVSLLDDFVTEAKKITDFDKLKLTIDALLLLRKSGVHLSV